jgi:uncharacterized protein (TIGR03435 family)
MKFRLPAIALAAVSLVSAQRPAAPRLKFDVASIKECRPGDPSPPGISSPGNLRLVCWPLSRLIGDAYETFAGGTVDRLRLPFPTPPEGMPDWADSARYTIEARSETPQTGAMMRGPMMQVLVEDRFAIRIHRETREVSGYLMTVDKGGLQIMPTHDGSCTPVDPTDFSETRQSQPCNVPHVTRNGPINEFDARGMSLDAFARLIHPDGKPAFDRTGLTGLYDIHMEWGSDAVAPQNTDADAASDPSPHSSQMEAMRKQLGLRLDPGKGSREVLVVDHVEPPSAN